MRTRPTQRRRPTASPALIRPLGLLAVLLLAAPAGLAQGLADQTTPYGSAGQHQASPDRAPAQGR